jgi:Protein of unknown function (DUF3054)
MDRPRRPEVPVRPCETMSAMARGPRVRRPGVVLALGDAATIVLFVALGLAGHDEGITLGGIARTAAPILVAWRMVATLVLRTPRPPEPSRRADGEAA